MQKYVTSVDIENILIRVSPHTPKTEKETRDNLAKKEILQDDRFFFIAGYTSGGAPYGVTWEEMGLKPWEDLEENE